MKLFLLKDDTDSPRCVVQAIHDIKKYCNPVKIYLLSRDNYDFELSLILEEQGIAHNYQQFQQDMDNMRNKDKNG